MRKQIRSHVDRPRWEPLSGPEALRRRQRVQNVDRPPNVKPLSEPTRHRRSRVDVKSALLMPRS